jgi:hypothetical protein
MDDDDNRAPLRSRTGSYRQTCDTRGFAMQPQMESGEARRAEFESAGNYASTYSHVMSTRPRAELHRESGEHMQRCLPLSVSTQQSEKYYASGLLHRCSSRVRTEFSRSRAKHELETIIDEAFLLLDNCARQGAAPGLEQAMWELSDRGRKTRPLRKTDKGQSKHS